MVESVDIVLSRTELYELVWSTPMRTLAPRYGLSDVGLAKICKRHRIPRPSRGYWAKLERGKPVRKWPLRDLEDDTLAEIRLSKRESRPVPVERPSAADPELASLIDAERKPENQIAMLLDLRGVDPLIAATRESLQKREPDEYGRVSRRYGFPGVCFQVCVSKASIQRALLLLHTLVQALKGRGYQLAQSDSKSPEPSFEVHGQKFRISVWEPSKRQKRELTKEEKEKKAKYSWWGIRDYEHIPTGLLELHVNRGMDRSEAKFADTKRAPLEQRLNDVVVCMLKAVDRERVAAELGRLNAIEKARRKSAAVALEVVRRTEAVREQRMLTDIPHWEHFVRVRNYVQAVRVEAGRRMGQIDPSSEIGLWLRWAEEYLEVLNPFSQDRELPSFALTPNETESLRKECETDWCDWLEAFRPRQPR